MTDYSKMSDAELSALVQPQGAAQPNYGGMSDADLLKAIQSNPGAPSTAIDVAKSAGVGVGKGTIGLGGMIGDLSNLGAAGIEHASNYVADKLGVARYQRPTGPSILDNVPTSSSIQKAVEDNVTGKFYEPQTTAGKYAQTAGEFLPAAAAGPGRLATKLFTGVTAGLGSEGAGQATEGTAAEPWARLGGAVVGGMAPSSLLRVGTPIPATAARQRLVDVLRDEGVTSLTAGQRTGSKTLQYGESILGDAPGAGAGATRVQQEGQRQFTDATLRRAGAGGEATPEVLAQNNARLGQQFEDLSARNNLVPDNQFVTDLVDGVRNYRRVPDSQQRAMVQGYVDDIIDHVNAGSMPGAQYQEMRSRLSRQSKGLRNSDPTLSEALRDMRNALDNAMGRSISPADREAWQTTRREYGAQKVIEKAASRAGEATAEGQIVPANLRNTVAAENRGAYARGQGDFSELARAGSGVMAPLPNSGTGQRVAINTLATLLGGGIGGVASGGLAAAGGLAAGAAAPGLAGRALMSRGVQGYLGNQRLTRLIEQMPAAPGRRALAQALLLGALGK